MLHSTTTCPTGGKHNLHLTPAVHLAGKRRAGGPPDALAALDMDSVLPCLLRSRPLVKGETVAGTFAPRLGGGDALLGADGASPAALESHRTYMSPCVFDGIDKCFSLPHLTACID